MTKELLKKPESGEISDEEMTDIAGGVSLADLMHLFFVKKKME